MSLLQTAPAAPSLEGRALMAAKRGVDIAMAGSFFLLFGWAYALVWIGVLLSSGRPAIYMQPRYGKNGRVFRFYKFRSMVADADGVLARHLREDAAARLQWAKYQKLDRDPRITPFGAILRKYSIDELPQFWNVLIGDMSVVGPRPPLPKEVREYDGKVYRRLFIKPGITGLWQVSGRSDLSWEESVRLDLRYVENWSITSDLMIMWRTAKVMVAPKGAY